MIFVALGLSYSVYITAFTEEPVRLIALVYMLLYQLIASLGTLFAMTLLIFLLRAELILEIDSGN